MSNLIENRKKVYENLPTENLSVNLGDIVYFHDIGKEDYENLIKSVKDYLLKCFELVYGKKYEWEDNFLEKYSKQIMELPNKTPNGILKPKSENEFEFNEILKNVNIIFKNLNLKNHIEALAIPNLRFKDSIEPEDVKNRPYGTTQYHSDAWVGHKGDSIFLIGLLGDLENNTVEFTKPINVHNNYLDKAESFAEGNTRYESFETLGKLQKGKLGIMDHACLHRTLLTSGCGPRLSMDIAVMIDSDYSHSKEKGFDPTAYDYIPMSVFKELGGDSNVLIEESIYENIF